MGKFLKIGGIIILIILIAFLAMVFYARYRLNNMEDRKDLEAEIDKKANDYLDKGNAYALVIGVVKQGKPWIKGYGKTPAGTAPDSLTIFELASCSKLYTTATLQILADEGVLDLDERIQDILSGKLVLPASASQTTFRHLATHLSGFPGLPEMFLAKMTDTTNPYQSLATADIYEYLKTCEGKRPDGTFEYSNFGMGLLGHLMELKTGVPYEELVKEKLLSPLGMHATFITADSATAPYIVQGYNENGAPNPVWVDTVLAGAGSFLSNGSDLLKFITANMRDEDSPVSSALRKTQEQQLKGKTGLGWILADGIDKFLGNSEIVWHNGMAGGYASFVLIDKKRDYGMFVLSNKAVDITDLGMRLTYQLRSQSWKEIVLPGAPE